jgi:hypothetical protein
MFNIPHAQTTAYINYIRTSEGGGWVSAVVQTAQEIPIHRMRPTLYISPSTYQTANIFKHLLCVRHCKGL